jgi:diguanylate cyclase (GGDEF)-like protein
MVHQFFDRFGGALTVRDVLQAGLGLAICVGVLLLDLSTNSDITEAFLLPLAFIAIYRVRRDWATGLITAVAVTVAILGGLLEEAGESLEAMLVNRSMTLAVIVGIGFLVHRVSASERQLFRIATTDPLTGIYNRRHFMTLLAREQERTLRYGNSFSLLILDIDHFKRINDRFGHPVGDEAIKAMAGAAGAHLRPTDIIGRFGGEEFVVLLPQTDEAGAVIAAERIRESVARVALLAGAHTVRFTVSVGATTFARPAKFEQGGIEELVACADHALYAAKTAGRNRVCVGRAAEVASAAPRLAAA